MTGQLEECYDSKGMQSVFNGKNFKYCFGGGRFHMLPQSYEFSHGFCLNNFLQVWLIGNQRDQVTRSNILIVRMRFLVWLEVGK